MKPLHPVVALCLALVAFNLIAPLSGAEPDSITARLAAIGIEGCTSVKAYTINLGEEHPAWHKLGAIDGKLNPNRGPESGIELSLDQLTRFLNATTQVEVKDRFARCFYPHHAIVFFGKDGVILGDYTICFMCNGQRHSIGSFSKTPDFKALSRLVRDLGLPSH